MSEARLARTRATLPEGYQFGDGRFHFTMLSHPSLPEPWAVPCVPPLIGDRRIRTRDGQLSTWDGHSWNVIEGEYFESDAERHPVTEGAPVNRSLGARILNA